MATLSRSNNLENREIAQEQIKKRLEFVVGMRNYGQLDSYEDSELESATASLQKIAKEARVTLEGISIVEQSRYDRDSEGRSRRYAVQ